MSNFLFKIRAQSWKIILSLIVAFLLLVIPLVGRSSDFFGIFHDPALPPFEAGSGGISETYGVEINTDDNAILPTANDTDATTGWSTDAATFDSITTAPYLGTYHFTIVSNANGQKAYKYIADYSLSENTLYKAILHIRHNGTGGQWVCGFGSGSYSHDRNRMFFDNTDTNYQDYILYFYYTPLDTAYFTCAENNASNDGGVYIDDFSLRTVETSLGSELYTTGNAISISNESNATTGWTNVDVDTFESTTDGSPIDGNYCFHINETTNPTVNARIYFDMASLSLTEGKRYLISFYMKHTGTGDLWRIGLYPNNFISSQGYGVLGSANKYQTTWKKYVMSFVYSSTDTKYLVFEEQSSTNNGELYLDALSIKEIVAIIGNNYTIEGNDVLIAGNDIVLP